MFLEKKIVSGILFTLLLVSVFVLASNIQTVEAASVSVYIRADGSIDPPTAPISTVDHVTYTLTGNIITTVNAYSIGIVVERDDIVVDGSGFTVERRASEEHTGLGIDLEGISNVTIQNMNIKNFPEGINLDLSSSNSIRGNNITNNVFYACGIGLTYYSSNNCISGNTITNLNGDGILLQASCSNNSFSGNNLTNNFRGIELSESSNNNISGNNVSNNHAGDIVLFDSSSNNCISGNTITDNDGAQPSGLYGNNGGIGLFYSSNYNSVSGNTFTGDGLYVSGSCSNSVENNTVNGKPLVYLEGVADQSVEDAGQVVLVRCDRIRVENLNLSATSDGIELWETGNCTVSGNNITANRSNGIELYSSSSNSIGGNIITNNFYGIVLEYSSSNNSISGNIAANNTDGIYLGDSSNYNSVSGNSVTNSGTGIILTYYSSNNSISGNTITDNGYGIYLGHSSSYNNISANTITNNNGGIGLYSSSNYNSVSGNTFTCGGLYVSASYSNIVENDTVNSRPLVYLEGVADFSVGDAGQVILIRCDQIRVENLNLSRTFVGVELWETGNCTVSGNNITANRSNGIELYSSSNISIVGNNITNNGAKGITFYSSSNSSIVGNNITNSYSDGISLTKSSYNSISGNNIANSSNCGIFVENATNAYNSIGGNTITHNGYGIYIRYSSSYNSIGGNNITHNGDGIVLYYYSNYNSIIGNNITANTDYGILLYFSSNNRFYHNNIIFNSQQVSISSSGYADVWDDGYPSGGNYWSDYNGTDVYSGPYQNQTGSDGIGDTPYVIDGVNRDNYPLTHSLLVNLIGDITGPNGWPDGKVDIRDVSLVANNFGKTVPPAPSNCDLTGPTKGVPDGKIDIRDISLVAKHFGEHYP